MPNSICSPRARGANSIMAVKFETAYGTPPSGNYMQLPFVSHSLGEEFGLIEDDMLGTGREGLDPVPDAITNAGDLTVPVDVRAFGHWLALFLGNPAANPVAAASAGMTIQMLKQPDVNSTITINGVAFTAKASGATGAQFNIGATLAETVANLVAVLEASSNSSVTPASYAAASGATKFTITHDTPGRGGNSFTVAAQAAFNAKIPTATLTGGCVKHVFSSGATCLPSAAIEFGQPDIGQYDMNYGVVGNTLRIGMSRSGSLSAALGLIGKGSTEAQTSAAGTPGAVEIDRFAQATGSIVKDGVSLASVKGASVGFSNNMEPVDSITEDQRIEGVDPGLFRASGEITTLWRDSVLDDAAIAREPVSLEFGWKFGNYRLTFKVPRVFLPKPKRSVTGPGGIQRTYNWQASGEGVAAMLTVELVNDVETYA